MAFLKTSRPSDAGDRPSEGAFCPCCGHTGAEPGHHRTAEAPAAPPPPPAATATASAPAARVIKIGVGRTTPCKLSAQAVMESASGVRKRGGPRAQPILPRADAPSLLQTLGDAPLPADEFAAACEKFNRPRFDATPALVPVTEPAEELPAEEPTPPPDWASTAAWPQLQEPPANLQQSASRHATAAHHCDAGVGLSRVIQAWPDLPPRVQTTILAMVNAHVR